MNPSSQVTFNPSTTATTAAVASPRPPATTQRSQTTEAANPASVSVVIARSAARGGKTSTRAISARCPAQFGSGSQRTSKNSRKGDAGPSDFARTCALYRCAGPSWVTNPGNAQIAANAGISATRPTTSPRPTARGSERPSRGRTSSGEFATTTLL